MKVGRPKKSETDFYYNQKNKTFYCQKCAKKRHKGKIIEVNGDRFRICIVCYKLFVHRKLIFVRLNQFSL